MTFEPKLCEGPCGQYFTPTGSNTKRCPECRADYDRKVRREYHQSHRVLKGRNQKGPNNNAWKGGVAPHYYQRIAFEKYGRQCDACKTHDGPFVIHHRDHNRQNNDVENLQVLCKRCHQIEHGCANNLPRGPTRPPKDDLRCPECKERFKPLNGRQTFCSSKCRINYNVKRRKLRVSAIREASRRARCRS